MANRTAAHNAHFNPVHNQNFGRPNGYTTGFIQSQDSFNHRQKPPLPTNRIPVKSGIHDLTAKAYSGKRTMWYRNGDIFDQGKMLVINRHDFANLAGLVTHLNRTEFLKRSPVNRIYTTEGQEITNLDQIQDSQKYVAATGEFVSQKKGIQIQYGQYTPVDWKMPGQPKYNKRDRKTVLACYICLKGHCEHQSNEPGHRHPLDPPQPFLAKPPMPPDKMKPLGIKGDRPWQKFQFDTVGGDPIGVLKRTKSMGISNQNTIKPGDWNYHYGKDELRHTYNGKLNQQSPDGFFNQKPKTQQFQIKKDRNDSYAHRDVHQFNEGSFPKPFSTKQLSETFNGRSSQYRPISNRIRGGSVSDLNNYHNYNDFTGQQDDYQYDQEFTSYTPNRHLHST